MLMLDAEGHNGGALVLQALSLAQGVFFVLFVVACLSGGGGGQRKTKNASSCEECSNVWKALQGGQTESERNTSAPRVVAAASASTVAK